MGGQLDLPSKKAPNGMLHNSVFGDNRINLSLSRRVRGAVLARRRQLARYHLNVTDGLKLEQLPVLPVLPFTPPA